MSPPHLGLPYPVYRRVEPVDEVAAEDEVELVVGHGGLAVAVPLVTHEVVQPAPLLLGAHHVHEALGVVIGLNLNNRR